MKLAQLIKLRNYISRYEWDAFRYPGQFIRLKQEQWQQLHALWQEEQATGFHQVETEEVAEEDSFFKKVTAFFKKDLDEEELKQEEEPALPRTEQELRQYFLNQLYPLQLKWATSTVTDVSFMEESYERDETLIYFLQRFPDIYLFMYRPVFNIKQAPVDGEIIMISPIGIEVIYLLEDRTSLVFHPEEGRTWQAIDDQEQRQFLSPLIALGRTEKIVRSILNKEDVAIPVSKTVLSRTNDFLFATEPYQTRLVGKAQYPAWFEEKRRLSSPLKNNQLRAAAALLKYCMTSSMRRPEWEVDQEEGDDPY